MPLRVEIITPEGELLDIEDATHVLLPGQSGQIGILPDHSPLASSLQVGLIHIDRQAEESELLSTSGGFVEVNSNHVMVLAETAERAEEIDVERAQKALERAREQLHHVEETERAELEAAIARANTRLRAAERH